MHGSGRCTHRRGARGAATADRNPPTLCVDARWCADRLCRLTRTCCGAAKPAYGVKKALSKRVVAGPSAMHGDSTRASYARAPRAARFGVQRLLKVGIVATRATGWPMSR